MVSPELEAAYARRKIGAITPSEGVDALVRELTWGDRLDSQVVYACAELGSLESLESPESEAHLDMPERAEA
jgi:hypothetical protein